MSTVTLGGITLNPSIQWTNRREFNRMAQGVKSTLGGGGVAYQQRLYKNLPIKLAATIDTGWLTQAMIDDIETLALMTGVLHVFNFHGTIHDIIFDYSAGAYTFDQIQYRQVPLSGDSFTGSINLLTA